MNGTKATMGISDESSPMASSPRVLFGNEHEHHQLSCIQELEQMILNDSWTSDENANESPPKKINIAPQLDEISQAILTGYSLKGYVRLLNVDHARAVADRLYNETNAAFCKFCDYEGTIRFDEDAYEACVKVARLAVNRRSASNQQMQFAYDSSQTSEAGSPSSNNGAASADARRLSEYVAYLSPSVPYPDLAKSLSSETSIQFVHTVQASTKNITKSGTPTAGGSTIDGRIDIAALTDALQSDIDRRTGRQTVLVVAVVGSSIFGHNDPITKLIELRNTYGFWLHLVGLNAASIATSKPPEQLMRALKAADSVTLSMGRWLGFKSLPLVTYVRSPDYVSSLYQREKLDSLPWWIILNHIQVDGIRKKIDTTFRVSAGVLKQLLSHPRFVFPGLGPSSDLTARLEKGSLMPPTVLTFKYAITRSVKSETGEITEELLDDEYTDSLNVWLAQGLSNECPSLGLQLVDLSKSNLGAAIRYCPLEQYAATLVNPSDYVNHFGERLRSTVNILDATVRAKDRLETAIIGKYPELMLVHLKKWAGVGGLAYIPAMFRSGSHDDSQNSQSTKSDDSMTTLIEWNEEQLRQISHFNIELVHSLRNSDGAFSIGESMEGLSCVKFGMLADDRDLEDLVEMVVKYGHELEESSQYVDSLAEMVRRGIEAANEGLRKENDERLMQEGVLRQVPLVGSLLNWWSPLPKEMNARGRTFDLKTGRILNTAELLGSRQNSILDSVTPSLTPHLPPTPSSVATASPSSKIEEDGTPSQTTTPTTQASG